VSEVVIALTALLEPASEFTKLAIQSLETRKVTEAVVKEWKPIVALTEKLWDYIKANPGLGIEAIGKALATPTSELTLPVRKLLAANRIRFEGERRGTKYSPM